MSRLVGKQKSDEEERKEDVCELAKELFLRHGPQLQPKDAFFYASRFYDAQDVFLLQEEEED